MGFKYTIMSIIAVLAVSILYTTIYISYSGYNVVLGHCDLCKTEQDDSCISYENVTSTWCLGDHYYTDYNVSPFSRGYEIPYHWMGWYAYGDHEYDSERLTVAQFNVSENGSNVSFFRVCSPSTCPTRLRSGSTECSFQVGDLVREESEYGSRFHGGVITEVYASNVSCSYEIVDLSVYVLDEYQLKNETVYPYHLDLDIDRLEFRKGDWAIVHE